MCWSNLYGYRKFVFPVLPFTDLTSTDTGSLFSLFCHVCFPCFSRCHWSNLYELRKFVFPLFVYMLTVACSVAGLPTGEKGDPGEAGEKGMRGLIGFPGIKGEIGVSLNVVQLLRGRRRVTVSMVAAQTNKAQASGASQLRLISSFVYIFSYLYCPWQFSVN